MCLGLIDLVSPYYDNGGVFEDFLLLSWGGRPLSKGMDRIEKTHTLLLTIRAHAELHWLRVLHSDAEACNNLYDEGPIIVDFERAEFHTRQPLGSISPSGQNRKRRRRMFGKQGNEILLENYSLSWKAFRGIIHSDLRPIISWLTLPRRHPLISGSVILAARRATRLVYRVGICQIQASLIPTQHRYQRMVRTYLALHQFFTRSSLDISHTEVLHLSVTEKRWKLIGRRSMIYLGKANFRM